MLTNSKSPETQINSTYKGKNYIKLCRWDFWITSLQHGCCSKWLVIFDPWMWRTLDFCSSELHLQAWGKPLVGRVKNQTIDTLWTFWVPICSLFTQFYKQVCPLLSFWYLILQEIVCNPSVTLVTVIDFKNYYSFKWALHIGHIVSHTYH